MDAKRSKELVPVSAPATERQILVVERDGARTGRQGWHIVVYKKLGFSSVGNGENEGLGARA